MTAQPPPTRIRFKLLDGLRLVAALAVVAYHYIGFQHVRWGIPVDEQFQFLSGIASYGALGVPLFFIISGFVILMSSWGRTTAQFVASRVARLYPAYWVSVLASVFLFVVVTQGTLKELTVPQVLVNLTMLQGGFGVERIEGAYWTLWIEFLFYILIGLLMARNPTRKRITVFVFLWPIMASIANYAGAGFLAAVLIPEYAPMFAGGMALYLIYKFGHSLTGWLLVALNAALSVNQIATGLFQGMIRNTGQDMPVTACAAIILVMFAVVALVTVSPLNGWGPNWLTYAGALTYPVYLMHENWGWWIISWANPIYGKWVALFLAVGFTLASAALIEKFVERKMTPRLRRAVRLGLEPERVKVPA